MCRDLVGSIVDASTGVIVVAVGGQVAVAVVSLHEMTRPELDNACLIYVVLRRGPLIVV